MKFRIGALLLCAVAASCSGKPATAAFGPVVAPHATVGPSAFGDLSYRVVGPAVMGGRLDAVASVPGDPTTIYLGHSSGGLYKSVDGGMNFTPIFDAGRTTSIGAIAIAPSNPKVIYVGTGEGFPRNTAALGDGVFRSSDAGKTWKAVGLSQSQHIAKIAIDPRNPDTVLVAAMGPEFSAGGERGIYRTSDGGKHWTRVLWVNDTTGGSDVAFDPSNPSIAFAGTFDYLRQPFTFRGGGVGSGLWRSNDGGTSWTRLTDPALHDGLPGGIINRVGFAISAHHPQTVYAIVPTKTGLLYRSDDGGDRWQSVSTDQDLVFRPFYFSQIRVDPDDVKSVWIVSGALRHSTDGGKKFKDVNAGGDNHDLWIDPLNPKRVLLGSDMGFDYSIDGGAHWSFVNTIPLSQIYRVGYDRDVPYHVMGGMQDHEVWWGPNEVWNGVGVAGGSWRNISDWGDGQYAVPDPRNPNIIYEDTHFGDLSRRNLVTGEERYISPQPAIEFGQGAQKERYRFNWSAPLLLSPLDPSTLYYGANVLFRTRNEGQTWDAISPDLTQPCDPKWLAPSGGPITHDNTNAETYCTIFAIAQGADIDTIWAGTDDGNLQLTTNGGASWTNLVANVKGLPPHAMVDSIETSRVDARTVFVTFDRHRLGDTHPYVYVTHDNGTTWTNLSKGLALWAYAIRQDPRAPRLLFAGTEDGIYASFDGGAHWNDLRLGTNHVPVYDLQIQPDANDLILGTHGRGFAILDDIAPLEGLARAVQSKVALFKPADAWRYAARPYYDLTPTEFVSNNKPYGATISYYLAPTPKPSAPPKNAKKKKKISKEKVQLQILDAQGTAIRHIEGTADGGVNRVTWDLTTDPPGGLKAKQDTRPYYVFYPMAVSGPEVLPGAYTVRLIARGATLDTTVRVRMDPAVTATQQELRAQYAVMQRLALLQERGETWVALIADDAKKL
ncbi:MAG TPA: hypothetical protein VNF68_10085, partial [Candidatus Baltobacteraceae bacterium]|nr:hypothetical protein [Candidatus Baltobacteraceae bacterium]